MKWLITVSMGFILMLFINDTHAQSIFPEWHNKKIKVKTNVPIKAYGFQLKEVKLLAGSPFYQARSRDSSYLQSISPDRLLYRFRKHAGLIPKDSIYGGWESEGLSGHTMGHYLSAVAMMVATTGSSDLKKNLDYTVKELSMIQAARGSGYLGAIPGEDSIFLKVSQGKIKASGFDLNGGWSPWYTVHKIMAGLCDTYYYTDNRVALQVVSKMADWVYATINHLDDSTRLEMLKCEYGGMNDVLAHLYTFTGNKKYLDLSYKFFDREVMQPLALGIDPLPGKHSNTNVPKAIGSARQYEINSNVRDFTIAHTFWHAMTNHHSYVIGGNSNYEFCGEPDQLNDRLSDNTCETCNTYNMLKLTRHLFAWSPKASFMDYYERALYNHILASQHAESGMMCYFVPLRMGTQKTYSEPFNTFTCCVGSGMENHSKYNEQIYSHDGRQTLYVNLFIPSEVRWTPQQLTLRQTTAFPESSEVLFEIRSRPRAQTRLAIRKPFWTDTLLIEINGKPYTTTLITDGYYIVDYAFKLNDRIRLQLQPKIYTESMPDNVDRVAFKYGPLVLAANLGPQRPSELDVPVLLKDDHAATATLIKDDRSLLFQSGSKSKPDNVEFIPFYKIKDQYYSVYFDYTTTKQLEQRNNDYLTEINRLKGLDLLTIDILNLGTKDQEQTHRLTHTERSYVDDALGRKGREARAGHYFQFHMRVDSIKTNQIIMTYLGDDKNRIWDLIIDDAVVYTINWPGGKTGIFYDLHYDIPTNITRGKTEVTIKVSANHNKTAGRVFTARTIPK